MGGTVVLEVLEHFLGIPECKETGAFVEHRKTSKVVGTQFAELPLSFRVKPIAHQSAVMRNLVDP